MKTGPNHIPIYKFFNRNNLTIHDEETFLNDDQENMTVDHPLENALTGKKKRNWLICFDCLVFSVTDIMTCSVCTKFCAEETSCTFVSGSRNYVKKNLDAHAISAVHIQGIKRKTNENGPANFYALVEFNEIDAKLAPFLRNIVWLSLESSAIAKCTSLV